MSYVKKSQLFKKNIKLRIKVAEDSQRHIFKLKKIKKRFLIDHRQILYKN